jgi:hypothetical protein
VESEPVGENVRVRGSNTSALASAFAALEVVVPPTMSTRPSANSVAVDKKRRTVIVPVAIG